MPWSRRSGDDVELLELGDRPVEPDRRAQRDQAEADRFPPLVLGDHREDALLAQDPVEPYAQHIGRITRGGIELGAEIVLHPAQATASWWVARRTLM